MNRLHAHGLTGLLASPWSSPAHAATPPSYTPSPSRPPPQAGYLHASTRHGGQGSPGGHGFHPSEHLPTRQFLQAGEEIDSLRALSVPHVLLSGVAISRRTIDEPEELQLLQPGDLVGLETFQRRHGERRIQALIDCELAPLRRMSDAEWRELLLHALLRRESRPGLASLRVGPVGERVRRMLLLLEGAAGQASDVRNVLELPPLASIAAVTASTNETVCRVVSHFRRSGLLDDAGNRKVRLMPGLQLSAGELPVGVTRSRTRSKSREPD
jgi:CRP-like cAMP-binding protein